MTRIRELKFVVILQALYSPDLTPSDPKKMFALRKRAPTKKGYEHWCTGDTSVYLYA